MGKTAKERYLEKLLLLKKLQREEAPEERREQILEVMDVLWESMTINERRSLELTSWPPPPKKENK